MYTTLSAPGNTESELNLPTQPYQYISKPTQKVNTLLQKIKSFTTLRYEEKKMFAMTASTFETSKNWKSMTEYERTLNPCQTVESFYK